MVYCCFDFNPPLTSFLDSSISYAILPTFSSSLKPKKQVFELLFFQFQSQLGQFFFFKILFRKLYIYDISTIQKFKVDFQGWTCCSSCPPLKQHKTARDGPPSVTQAWEHYSNCSHPCAIQQYTNVYTYLTTICQVKPRLLSTFKPLLFVQQYLMYTFKMGHNKT